MLTYLFDIIFLCSIIILGWFAIWIFCLIKLPIVKEVLHLDNQIKKYGWHFLIDLD